MSTWQLDRAHTVVQFTAKHMMITKVRGQFTDVDGTIELDESDLTKSSVEVRIGTASVDTGMEPRDNHLRSADFLDAGTYPTMTFRSTAIERAGRDYRMHGDLTIRDVTRPVTLNARFLGIVPGMQGGRHAGFEATTTIKRTEWGLTWNVALETGGWLVSEHVTIELEVAADEVAQALGADSVAA